MAIITPTLLGSINNGLQLSFNTQLYEAESVYREFTFDAESTGAAEVYPRLDQLQGIREWLGARLVQQLGQQAFTITNRKFEQTISIARTDLEDDRYGIYAPVAAEMGQTAKRFPDLLVSQLITSTAATTALGIDGVPFFSTAHPNYTKTGLLTTTSNYNSTGTSPYWYLVDNSRVLKPFIYQRRTAFELVARFNPDDPNVFDNDEYLWGTRGRGNAGFGLWQLVYASNLPLNATNLIAARTAMALIRRPDGTPMGITPNLLVVPSTLFPIAKSYYEDGLVANDPAAPTTLYPNTVRNMFKPLEFKWLN
jgi:phage major head subunit gpT-like protein